MGLRTSNAPPRAADIRQTGGVRQQAPRDRGSPERSEHSTGGHGLSVINVVGEAVRRSATRALQLGRWRGVERASRSTRVVVDRFDAEFGIASDWPQSGHARYYEKSAAVHAAVKVRADAVARPGLRVLVRESGSLHRGEYRDAGADDPMTRLLERPNEMWTQGQLLRATETYLALWGSAFWGIERDSAGNASELWPLRPDRVRIIPDRNRHVRGFVYEHGGERAAYLPQEIVWFRHINPADEFLGMSSLSPARLAVDMGEEALSFNRSFFRNSTMPSDLAITTEETPTEDEVSEFYARWESRFRGSGKAHRPVLLSRGMDAKRLGISQKDMEFTQALGGRWRRWPVRSGCPRCSSANWRTPRCPTSRPSSVTCGGTPSFPNCVSSKRRSTAP